jgi:hypothetical protein
MGGMKFALSVYGASTTWDRLPKSIGDAAAHDSLAAVVLRSLWGASEMANLGPREEELEARLSLRRGGEHELVLLRRLGVVASYRCRLSTFQTLDLCEVAPFLTDREAAAFLSGVMLRACGMGTPA